MKGWKTKNQPKPEFEATWDWITRKEPEYCRPHGRRIILTLNNQGLCRKCCDLMITELERLEAERLEAENEMHSQE